MRKFVDHWARQKMLRQLYAQANKAFKQKSYKTEAPLLEKILELEPERSDIIQRLGPLYYNELGDFGKAAVYFEKMRKMSHPLELFFHLGYCYYQCKNFLKARENLEKYLKKIQGQKDRQARELSKRAEGLLESCKEQLIREKERKLQLKEERGKEAATKKMPPVQEVSSEQEKATPLTQPAKEEREWRIKITYLPPEDKATIELLKNSSYDNLANYQLRLQYHHLTLFKGYDELVCLNQLHNVEKFWYQIETVKKVLKQFRGRVLLCDEVGLGKTIEAGMLIKEYLLRGMIKKILILTPTSLVSQWREELLTKFDLYFATTDDPAFKQSPAEFWKKDQIIASLNIAKSRHHFQSVIDKEYDLVVVDEVHHLKNRQTLNWKLVDSLKKRFIFLLSATPVQNNLVELYNLLTLLKPGIFKTESHFKKEHVRRGNSRLPSNREKLQGLLREVMIRNKRSLVDVRLPKRFAQTILIEPSELEKGVYERVSNFVRENYHKDGNMNKFTLNLLLMEAGSSPFALKESLNKLLDRGNMDMSSVLKLKEIISLTQEVSTLEKGKRLLELVKKTGDKKIVFARYYKTLAYIASLLEREGIPFTQFRGDLTNLEKDKALTQFRDGVDLLLSSESGGEGRNIQFCNTMINYDLPWNPMLIEQRIGRIHRIGQTRDIFIFNLSVKDTIEDYILRVLDQKINMFQLVIGEIESILGNMETEEDFEGIIMDIWVKSSNRQELEEHFDDLGERLLEAKRSYEKTKELDETLFGDDYEV